jgi:hypothetical protein
MDNCIVCKSKCLDIFLKVDNLTYWKCGFCEAKFLDKKNYISYNEEKKHYLKHNNSLSDQGYRDFLQCLINPLKDKISNNDFGLDYGCGYAPALADILKKDGFDIDIYDPFFFPNQNIFLKNLNLLLVLKLLNIFLNHTKNLLKLIT